MGTGKEQSIKITASSGLSDEEIENLVKDAELHAEEDKKKRELVDARNMADSLIYSSEKSMKEAGDSLDDSSKGDIDKAIENLKKAMEGDDTEEIKRLTDELTQASHKLAEAMYAKASAEQAQADAAGGAESTADESKDEDVVDADFEEVKK
jgi:molecular chaperone DnaK